MMAEPEKSSSGDEICPICNRPKLKHTPEEMLECSKKIQKRKKDEKK